MRAILRFAMRIGVLFLLVSAAAWAQPVNVPFRNETPSIPGNQAGDTAILRDPWGQWGDTVYGTDSVLSNGLYGFAINGGTTLSTSFGAVGGVDARQQLFALPQSSVGGLLVVSATNLGELLFFTTEDAGVAGSAQTVGRLGILGPRAVALGDFGDAGAFVFVNSQATMMPWWQLTEDGGAVIATSQPSIQLPAPPLALATASFTRLVYASVGNGGVFEIDPFANPPSVIQVIDAGAPNELVGGLATYPQRDGGSLLVTSVPALNLFRVYAAQTNLPALHLADFTVSAGDGGRRILGASSLDVWPGAFGVTDAGATYDAGVIVISDRLDPTGANYKVVSWADLARSVRPPLPIDLPDFVPPPVVVQPVGVPSLLAVAAAATTLDVGFWPGLDTLVATLDGVSFLSPRDLRLLRPVADAGAADGGVRDAGVLDGGSRDGGADAGVVVSFSAAVTVSALGPTQALAGLAPFGVLAVGANTSAGTSLWARGADGGLDLILNIAGEPTTTVQLADFADAGLWLFAGSRNVLRQFRLDEIDGGSRPSIVRATAGPDITFAETISSVASWAPPRRLFVSTRRGVFEVDPFAMPASTRAIADAGVSALALYLQRDGGAMVFAALADDRIRVIRANDGVSMLDFQVILPDRISLLRGVGWLDVTREPVGLSADGGPRDGGVRWPSGALAVGATADGGGTIVIVDWAQLARSATPPLPIDVVSSGSAGGSAGTGGGTGGGGVLVGGGTTNRSGGAGGGGDEPPPPGCCTGAPSSGVVPALAFLLWLRRFMRRGAK